MNELPIARHFIACENVVTAEARRYTLEDVVFLLRPAVGGSYPLADVELCFWALLTNGRGAHDFVVEQRVGVGPASRLLWRSKTGRIELGSDPLALLGLPFRLRGLRFPGPDSTSSFYCATGKRLPPSGSMGGNDMSAAPLPEGHGRGEFVKARILPEVVFDAGEGLSPPVGHGTGEWVRAVILPPVEFNAADPADTALNFVPRPVVKPAGPEQVRLAELAGSVATELAALSPEDRRSALAAFLGQARTQIAAFDPGAASLLNGLPGR